MVGVFWYGDSDYHIVAEVLLVDEPDGEFQEWIRERCPSSVAKYNRSVAGGTRSEVWLRPTQEVKEALEERLDDIYFDDRPYRGGSLGQGVFSQHFFHHFQRQPSDDLP